MVAESGAAADTREVGAQGRREGRRDSGRDPLRRRLARNSRGGSHLSLGGRRGQWRLLRVWVNGGQVEPGCWATAAAQCLGTPPQGPLTSRFLPSFLRHFPPRGTPWQGHRGKGGGRAQSQVGFWRKAETLAAVSREGVSSGGWRQLALGASGRIACSISRAPKFERQHKDLNSI